MFKLFWILCAFVVYINYVSCHDEQSPLMFLKSQEAIFNEDLQLNNKQSEDILNTILDLYLPNPQGNLTDQCRRDVMLVLGQLSALAEEEFEDVEKLQDGGQSDSEPHQSFLNQSLWQMQMIDSWGKGEDGLFVGNIRFLGMLDECLDVYVDKHVLPEQYQDVKFRGKYCYFAYYNIPNITASNSGIPKPRMALVPSSSIIAKLAVVPGYGTCVPSSCSDKEIHDSVKKAIERIGGSFLFYNCMTDDAENQADVTYDDWQIAGITIFSCFGAILLIATIADYYADLRPDSQLREGAVKYLLAFSPRTNIKKILKVQTSLPKNVIAPIHGVRCLTLIWIIWCHQLGFIASYSQNGLDIRRLSKPVITQIFYNADKSVDSFFTIGGMMLIYVLFNQMEKTRKFNVIYYYLHRILRLMPALAMSILFAASIVPFLAEGPMSKIYAIQMEKGCYKTWWAELLFIGNFILKIPMFRDDPELTATCLPHSWYVSVDMQIYIIIPILILPIFYKKKLGLALLSLWTIFFTILPGALIWANDYKGSGTLLLTPEEGLDIYAMPWCRVQAYLIGVWAGYLLYINKDKKVHLTTTQVLIGWTCSTVLGIILMFGVYPFNNFSENASIMPLVTTVIFQMFQRGAWAAILSWIILACHWGYGGFINSILSYPGFQPISRLSYTMYLTVYPLQNAIIMAAARLPVLSYYHSFETTTGMIIIGFFSSLMISLTAESPVINMERLILQPKKKSIE